jgi:hypothetical protein
VFSFSFPKPRKTPKKNRQYNLKARYGITPAQYDEMLEKQNGRCKICGYDNKKNLVVDHCHETKEVRAILCQHCNRALGKLKENTKIMKRMIRYVEDRSNLRPLKKRIIPKDE